MTPQQWDRIGELFNQASQLPPDQRDAYLVDVCPDEDLRLEVQSLLKNTPQENFLGLDLVLIGRTLCQYKILEEIGRGSMGLVYKAHDTKLDRIVALKFLPPELKKDSRGPQRLLREARSASSLNHPNIVTVHDIARDDAVDADFIVMEFISGNTLSRSIPREGLPCPLALDYAIQIADALATAHDQKLFHGDLKPANIMVTDKSRVKLLDFSLARVLNREISDPAKSERFGTTAYMAPERIGTPLVDPRSEGFSFGVILYQMLSGKHPFGTGTSEEMSVAIHHAKQAELGSKVPEWLGDIAQRCLEKSPADRFQNMTQVLAALKREPKTYDASDTGAASSEIPASEMEIVRGITGRIAYGNFGKSQRALTELGDLFARGMSSQARETAISVLTDIILTIESYPYGVPDTVRKLRKLVMDRLKSFTAGNLAPCFKDSALEALDLFEMDLSRSYLSKTSFRGCFLAGASFQDAILAGASFAGAFVRNVNFAGSDLTAADFTDIDWFNTVGLTESQLSSVQRNTLRACPWDIEAMHRYLRTHYGFPFESWPENTQEQLKAAWNEYLKPQGLRDIAALWRRNP